VLARAGLLTGRAATSFPGFLNSESAPGIRLSEAPVVIDGKVVTSRGPGTAMEFGLALIELLEGASARQQVQVRLQLPGG
jgi:4-methyl-5(b-hydroxyethyl)-thiazole monophosphate biosynthesis